MPEPGSRPALGERLPGWFRQELPDQAAFSRMRGALRTRGLRTVCEGARCPNMGHCWNNGTATFMIMGGTCTRACHFCAVPTGRPEPVDAAEPVRVAGAVQALGLRYAVITSVTRDDLEDEGAGHFVRTVQAIREISPAVKVELLVPDFSARRACFEVVAAAGPDVLGHNIETVRRLSPALRPRADHDRSLRVLSLAKSLPGTGFVKSGLMVGLGETDDEVLGALAELKKAGCDIVTIGQYLAPAADGRQRPVARFVAPEVFDMYRREGMAMGFMRIVAGPLVRSSFLAEEVYEKALEGAIT
ncbi:MAG: lipoyl synthase [Candidatus Omnitrophota bacterium]